MPIAIGIPGDEPLTTIPRERWAETLAENQKLDIDWNGPKCPVTVAVELPFWLMIPESSIEVTLEDTTLTATIHNQFVEVQDGPDYRVSHVNTVYIGPEEPLRHSPMPREVQEIQQPVFRRMKTVVAFAAESSADAIAATKHTHPFRLNRAERYFSTLAVSHIPFLNHLITAYRATSRDPFAHEVSDWDVSLWWILTPTHLVRAQIMPYWDNDSFPTVRHFGMTERTPFHSTTTEAVQHAARNEITAGQLELLDAHSLAYRGRFGDAVRSAVTAIEVALEARITTVLRERGLSEKAITERLASTRDSFYERLVDYERIIRKRIPGPLVSILPYLNGIRLRQELGWVRNLRHKIVHEGIRVDIFARGAMQRAIETMTWLFEWLSLDDDGDSPERNRNLEMFSVLRGMMPLFPFSYTDHGVVIEDDKKLDNIVPDHEKLLSQYIASITPEKNDLELFVAMTLDGLRIRHGATFPEHKEIPIQLERFITSFCEYDALVFPVALDGLMEVSDLASIALRKAVYTSKGSEVTALCIINHQQHLDPVLRERGNAITREVEYLASEAGITVILTTDLCALVCGAMRYQWDFDALRRMLHTPGWQGTSPPCYQPIGTFRKLYRKIGAMSVELQAGQTLAVGETIGLNLLGQYFEQPVASLHVDHAEVQTAIGPCLVGIGTSLKAAQLRVGQVVFLRVMDSPPEFAGEGI